MDAGVGAGALPATAGPARQLQALLRRQAASRGGRAVPLRWPAQARGREAAAGRQGAGGEAALVAERARPGNQALPLLWQRLLVSGVQTLGPWGPGGEGLAGSTATWLPTGRPPPTTSVGLRWLLLVSFWAEYWK